MKNTWMVRAGRGARHISEFTDNSIVAIGWSEIGEIDNAISKDILIEKAKQCYPNASKGKLAIWVGQVIRFLQEVEVGDTVLSYDSGRRVYMVGTVESDAKYDSTIIPDLPRIRKVKWEGEVSRDQLSTPTKNTLGAISTLFLLSESAAEEIQSVLEGKAVPTKPDVEGEEEDQLLDNVKEQSKEYIKDSINRLGPYELQDLVAGVLRAMGYKTRVSPPGADRGIDIIASPDGFGFEQPRIVVECKHRRGAMGSQEIRGFLGGRHKDDKGLYVSTGGFSKDARYEAERANIPVTLMDLDQLVDAVLEHYEEMDTETRVLLPLVKVYWPA